MTSYLAFVGVAAGTVLLPGPDMLVVLRTALAAGTRSGVWAALGSGTGNLLWGTATVLGVTAVLAASPAAFGALKLGGAAYLAWLAVQALRAARRGDLLADPDPAEPAPSAGRAFRRGLASDLANDFAKRCQGWKEAMVLTMALLAFAGMGAFAVVAGRLRAALARPLASRVVNGLVGVLLMALAAGLAVAH